MNDVNLSFILEREVQVEYFVEDGSIGGQSETDDRHEKLPATINLYAVKVPMYANGVETETMQNIIHLLSPDEIESICDEIKEKEGLCL